MTENEIKEYIADLRNKADVLRKSGFATNGVSNHFDKSADVIEELLSYRAIGTIEEIKALKEKSVAKKPIYSDFDENEAEEIIPYKAVCPICGHEFEFESWNEEENHHCICGQKLDWQ